jgi:hypothetical protein
MGDQVPTTVEVIRIFTTALEGDGSTEYMPDVRPIDACVWVLQALDANGYEVRRKPWWRR